MTIMHTYTRGGTVYWQRKVPADLLDRYPSSPLKINLRTNDPRVIASKVARLDRQHEALWDAMRRDPTLTPKSTTEEAHAVLKAHGLPITGRGADELALSLFFDYLEGKRQTWADNQPDPEEAYHGAPIGDYLSKAEAEAVRIIKTADLFLLSDALELYLKEHPERGQDGFDRKEEYARRDWGKLIALVGDKVFKELTREDARAFRDSLIATVKTTSVQRSIRAVSAVFSRAATEQGWAKTLDNPFSKLSIAGLGKDSDKRGTFTADELAKVRSLCLSKDDDIRWLLALQVELGARIGELAGLALADLVLDHETPHVVIQAHPWRTLKNDNSAREVPLVGAALWAARRIKETAKDGQLYAFPRYIKDGECKADSASAGLNKWLRLQGIDHTTHELRHTMRDRLRDSGATRDIQDAVGGWGQSAMGDTYGKGYALKTLQAALLRTLPVSAPSQ